ASGSAEPQVLIPTLQSGSLSDQERLSQLEENQRLISEHVDEQYQIKVESSSRYRTKLSGVVMLNAFANQGHVESEEVPNLALRRGPTDTVRTFGLTALQSQLGFEAYGPNLAGARVSAGLQFDFMGTASNTTYGNTWGAVRLRTATVRLDWQG